jgi:hypothetical protein
LPMEAKEQRDAVLNRFGQEVSFLSIFSLFYPFYRFVRKSEMLRRKNGTATSCKNFNASNTAQSRNVDKNVKSLVQNP